MKKMFILVLLLAFWHPGTDRAQDGQITEYRLKAAFLYHFAKFVTWPASAFADSTEPIIIGVIGRDPFGRDLEKTVAGKTVRGRRFVVKRFRHIDDLEFCHILFITPSERKHVGEILRRIDSKSVLTVGDTRSFATQGVIINLFSENYKIRFDINAAAAKEAGLRISSRLLRLAKRVQM